MIIYSVWSGEYSDRRLLGLFSTEEKAEAYLTQRKVLDSEIDDKPLPIELDKVQPIEKVLFLVFTQYKINDPSYKLSPSGLKAKYQEYNFNNAKDGKGVEGHMYVEVNFHPDYQVMEKAAIDRYYMLLAKKKEL